MYSRRNVFYVKRWHSKRYYTIDQGTEKRRDINVKWSTRTTEILVSLGTDFLWKIDVVYSHWNVFSVKRWHSKRYYTIHQGTEKRRDINVKLSTRTTEILVCLGTDFLWKIDVVYSHWNVFYVNRWHSKRYYTIHQGTEKRRDINVKLSTRTTEILVCLGTDFLWKIDVVYSHWNVFCVKRWHSKRYYTIHQGTEKRRDINVKLSTRTTEIRVSLRTDFLWKIDVVYSRRNVFYVKRWHSKRYYTIHQGTEKRRDINVKLSTRTTEILVSLGTDFLWKIDVLYSRWNVFYVNRWHSKRYYTIDQGTEKRRDINVKWSTRTTEILVCLGTDFWWKIDVVYSHWNVCCVKRWHSKRYYTIHQATEKRRDINVKWSTRTTEILVSLGTDFLWKIDVLYSRWNVFYVNRWHSKRYYTIHQGTEKRRDINVKLSTRTTEILVCLGTDFLWKIDVVYSHWNVFYVNRWHSKRYYTIHQGTEKRRDINVKLSTRTTEILVCLGTDFLWKIDVVYSHWNVFCVKRWHSKRYYTIHQGTEKRRDINVKLSTRKTEIRVSLRTDFLWKIDVVYSRRTYFT